MQRKKGEVTRSITNVVMREKKTIIYAHLIFERLCFLFVSFDEKDDKRDAIWTKKFSPLTGKL